MKSEASPDVPEAADQSPSTERGLDAYANRNASAESQSTQSKPSSDYTISIPKSITRFVKMQYWQQYFQISQDEVINRIVQSVKPMKSEFIRISKSNPDLYGPFWIMTTIIVLVSITGNLARYIKNIDKHSKFQFRMELVRYAVFIIYGFGAVFPMALGIAMQFLKSSLTAANVVCLYGYSMSTFLGISVLCIIPSPVLHWLLAIYGVLNSTALVLSNLHSQFQKLQKRQCRILYGVVAFAQLTFLLLFKTVFYDISYKA